ncbi:MAG: hypothetical protein JWN61_3389, partial [Pseudonocardiales bacterium]|nr:hypothetical protein [Pseudonocardiales bacterium]
VSTVWKALADYSAVPAAMTALCAQIAAGRIVPIYTLYRAATITSTAGSYYRFHRIETKRAIAGSELHLHPGKKNDLNNAGFKPSGGGKGEARREPVKPGDYQKIKVAMGASWRAD